MNIEIVPADVLADNIISQVDEEGQRDSLFKEIFDHRKDTNAIDKKCTYITNPCNDTKIENTQLKDGIFVSNRRIDQQLGLH